MNLQQLLQEHGVQHRLGGSHQHVRDGWIGVDCPWCGRGSGKFHLGIELATGRTNCWRCGPHRLGAALAELTGESLRTVLGWVGELRDTPADAPRRQPRGSEGPGRLRIPSGVEVLKRPHRRYLRGRGLDPDDIQRLWGVRGIGISPNLAWRLWIPIHLHNEIVSWTTRSIGSKGTRYISAAPDEESLPHRSLLYGEDRAVHAVVVCEGPVDVWRLGPGAVATLGVGFTPAQVDRISRYTSRAICFDSEESAQHRARQLARQLVGYPGDTVVVELESGKDVAEAHEDEIQQLKKEYLK